MNQQIYSFNHDQLLNYLDDLKGQEREGNQSDGLRTLVDFVTLKKNQWSFGLQKLMYRYFDMSFEQNDHQNLTRMLKEYRSVTQVQYSDSLNDVLVYFRDRKLTKILEEFIESKDLQFVKSVSNIEDQEPTGDLLADCFDLEDRKNDNILKANLRIVWNGYKSIIETVKSNSKLEELFMSTLDKLFEFALKYNRKQQFKEFCRALGYGLHNVLGKKFIQTQSQKTNYTDYEKTQVNERNVLIRFNQFDVALKLGLWQSCFQIIEDINQLLNIRKGVIKRSTQSKYYLYLSKLFKKSGYWNYYAFAYFNYYNIYSRNPKIDPQQLQSITDDLLLSVLSIPAFSVEDTQSLANQKKISNLMVMVNKVPTKEQLYNLIVEKGILQSASDYVKNLWTFFFVEFNLLDVPKKLPLLQELNKLNPDFSDLIEGSVINHQLLQISKIYTKIKVTNLYKIIPFSQQQVLKRLLSTQQNGIIQFKFDEISGIIQFKKKSEQKTAYSQLNRVSKEIAIIAEKLNVGDKTFIVKKVEDLLAKGTQFYEIRKSKIEQFTEKLKKPRKEAREEEAKQIEREKKAKQAEDAERKLRQEQNKVKQGLRQKQLTQKKNLLKQIIKIKDRRVIRMSGKIIQNLDDRDLDAFTVDDIQELKKQTERKNKQDTQNKYKKAFVKTDYIQRQRRRKAVDTIKQGWIVNVNETSQIIQKSKQSFDIRIKKKQYLNQIKAKITEQMINGRQIVTKKYNTDIDQYRARITKQFKQRIVHKAKQLRKEAQQLKVKQEQDRKRRQEQRIRREKQQQLNNPFFIRRSNIPSGGSNTTSSSSTISSTTQSSSSGWRNSTQTQPPPATSNTGNTGWRKTQNSTPVYTTTTNPPTDSGFIQRSNKPAVTQPPKSTVTSKPQDGGWRKKN